MHLEQTGVPLNVEPVMTAYHSSSERTTENELVTTQNVAVAC